ncbi:hypothetical protein SFRURICE_018408 [Spodoptera frugiperda]|uniref:SFRICE_028698 n=1 Tax=Spodoptera frugiperda TaxID=7108 RepID=A0A2H1W146_SPOFR|nr:hypothetical protein SFRURICE_018408 [Spodoptera frugiperda]
MEKSKIVSQNSLRIKQRTKTRDNINVSHEMDDAGDAKSVRRDKCLSNSVDAIVTHNDAKSKVICSAKGLLETNLDDLFNDVQKLDGWNVEPKSLGASEPTLSFSENNSKAVKRESLVSEDDTDDDTASDSDCTDEVVREQRICMGARRFGHLLRRVISRNGLDIINSLRGSFANRVNEIRDKSASSIPRESRCTENVRRLNIFVETAGDESSVTLNC